MLSLLILSAMAGKLRIAVFFGGKSAEHEISLLSAASIIQGLDKTKYEVIPIGITKEGRLATPEETARMLPPPALASLAGAVEDEFSIQNSASAGRLVEVKGGRDGSSIDVVFPVLHGPYGEDGTIQGLFELTGLPYVGCGVLASAVGMDKEVQKRLFRAAGLPVVDFLVYTARGWRENLPSVRAEIETTLGYPCFVKPACLGSSIGVTKVHGRDELEPALELASKYDRKIIVERGLNAREIECSVLGNDRPEASVPGEIVPAREFYDYQAKYHDPNTRLLVPAPLDERTAERVRELAVRAFQALDCSGLARVDFLLDSDGEIYINEINTMPGFTSVSMYPRLWEASGLGFAQLLDRLIALALERHEERRRLRSDH